MPSSSTRRPLGVAAAELTTSSVSARTAPRGLRGLCECWGDDCGVCELCKDGEGDGRSVATCTREKSSMALRLGQDFGRTLPVGLGQFSKTDGGKVTRRKCLPRTVSGAPGFCFIVEWLRPR